jgi:hypothetical protein
MLRPRGWYVKTTLPETSSASTTVKDDVFGAASGSVVPTTDPERPSEDASPHPGRAMIESTQKPLAIQVFIAVRFHSPPRIRSPARMREADDWFAVFGNNVTLELGRSAHSTPSQREREGQRERSPAERR